MEEPCQVDAAVDGWGVAKLSESAAFLGTDSSVEAAIADEGRAEAIALGYLESLQAAGPAGGVTVTFAAVGSWDCSAVQVKSLPGAASAGAVAGGVLVAEMMKAVALLALAASVDRLCQALAIQHSAAAAAAFAAIFDAAVSAARQLAAAQCCLGNPAAVQGFLENPAAGPSSPENPAAGPSFLEIPAAGSDFLGNLLAGSGCLENPAAGASSPDNPAAGPNCLGNLAAEPRCLGNPAAVQSCL